MNDNNICIRVNRDIKQIEQCKQRLKEIESSVSDLSRIVSLAGNMVRMKILLILQEEEMLCVCDLGEILEMKVPAISQHLRKLKDAGLVQTARDGTTIYYNISIQTKPVLEALFQFVAVKLV